MPVRSEIRSLLVRGPAVALAFFASGWCGLQLAATAEQASAVWPPAGIALLAVWRYGPKILPFVWLGGLCTTLSTGAPPGAAAGIAIGNVLEAFVAVTLLRRLDFRPPLDRARDVGALWLGGGLGAALVSALLGTGVLWLAGMSTAERLADVLWVWLLGDSMGVLVVAPFLFTFPTALRSATFRGRAREVAVLCAALVAVTALVFAGDPRGGQLVYARAFLLFPPAVWAALRFGPPGASLCTLLVSAATLLGTALGRGPFAGHEAVEGVASLQLFLGVLALTTLLLAAISSERRRAEQRLVAAERLAAVGTIAAGVAHELNNPLSFVITNLELVERRLPVEAGELRTVVQDARLGAERMHVVVQDLRVFGRDGGDERQPVALDTVVASALRLAARQIRPRARIVRDLAGPPPVLGCEARLGQVVLNLLLNAAQAVEPGRPEENEIRVSTGVARDGRAFVEVADTGGGIPPELRERIFAPFFTTRRVGGGTGLGLSICASIVSDHRGSIEVDSAVGGGSRFRVLLPPAPRTAAVPAQPVPAPPPTAGGRKRVLVVDDEVRLARSIQRLLEPDHEVNILHSASDALDELLGGRPYDLVLCDLHMPGVSGVELHRRLHAQRPDLAEAVIFVSGGAFTPEARAFVRQRPDRVLHKPLRPAQLLALVQAAGGDDAAA